MTAHPPFTASQPLAVATGSPLVDGHLFEDGHCATAREHRQLRRVAMHVIEHLLRSAPSVRLQAGGLAISTLLSANKKD